MSLKCIGQGLHGLSPSSTALNLNNSGTSMRLLCGLLSGQSFSSQLIGDDFAHQKTMARIVEPLRKMGAEIKMSDRQTAPLFVQGGRKLTGRVHQVIYRQRASQIGIIIGESLCQRTDYDC